MAFRAGWVDGPDGPVLAETKTRRSHVVDLDLGTCEIVARYAATVGTPVGEGFVFSDGRMGGHQDLGVSRIRAVGPGDSTRWQRDHPSEAQRCGLDEHLALTLGEYSP